MITLARACLAAVIALSAMAGAAAAQQGQSTALTPEQMSAEAHANAVINSYSYYNGGIASDSNTVSGSALSRWLVLPLSCDEAKPMAGAKPPRVVKVKPAAGSTVRPGALVLSVTFDQDMACGTTLAQGSPFPVPCPGDKRAVIAAPDRRTFTTVCQVEAGSSYSMPITDFVSARGAKSERYDLEFVTSTQPPVTDARAALSMEKAGPVLR